MRMMIKATFAAVILAVLLSVESFSAETVKIGIIDFQQIIETSSAGKKAQDKINAEGKQMEADLKQKGEEIKQMEKALERERMVLSKEALEDKQREVRIKINDFKSLQAKYRSDLKKLESRVIKEIEDEVFNLVEEIAKDNDYFLVLEKRAGGVVYFKEAMDITNLVIQKYDQKASAERQKPKE